MCTHVMPFHEEVLCVQAACAAAGVRTSRDQHAVLYPWSISDAALAAVMRALVGQQPYAAFWCLEFVAPLRGQPLPAVDAGRALARTVAECLQVRLAEVSPDVPWSAVTCDYWVAHGAAALSGNDVGYVGVTAKLVASRMVAPAGVNLTASLRLQDGAQLPTLTWRDWLGLGAARVTAAELGALAGGRAFVALG